MSHVFSTRAAITAAGFSGFETVAALRANRLAKVPQNPGVYMVVRDPHTPPVFLAANPGGRFKGRDPTVSIGTLTAAWVDPAIVLYIGKAGASSGSATLRSRLGQLLDFGAGKPIGHWGGRYLWQLEGMNDARICWSLCPEKEPADVESGLIDDFAAIYGKRPFANLRD